MRHLLSLGVSALVVAGTLVACAESDMNVASASTRSPAADSKAAASLARKASRALGSQQVDQAVAFAEQAVALAPRVAAHRSVLGQAYLAAGRFASARTSFADALALGSIDGKDALDLALATTAGGDAAGARRVLDTHYQQIAASDLGLALALAGDPAAGVAVLTQAARAGQSNATLRQNLALAYALGGQWGIARVVIAADMPSDKVDARLEQWAAFARPQSASDQVAALLGVQPIADAGQPTALALNAPVPVAPVVSPVAPVVSPVAVAVSAPQPVTIAAPSPVVMVAAPSFAPEAAVLPAASTHRVSFAARREQVQDLPVATIPAELSAAKIAVRAAPVRAATGAPAAGTWFVQLGAFENAAVARDGWSRTLRRFPALGAHQPQGAAFRQGSAVFYRLSVGGFARQDADRLCRSLRNRAGTCFVRAGAGDQIAAWARPNQQLASR